MNKEYATDGCSGKINNGWRPKRSYIAFARAGGSVSIAKQQRPRCRRWVDAVEKVRGLLPTHNNRITTDHSLKSILRVRLLHWINIARKDLQNLFSTASVNSRHCASKHMRSATIVHWIRGMNLLANTTPVVTSILAIFAPVFTPILAIIATVLTSISAIFAPPLPPFHPGRLCLSFWCC
jgi:hypothetical protein